MERILPNIKEYVNDEFNIMANYVENMIENPTQPMPHLIIVQHGNLEESNRYVRGKIKDCEKVGIKADLIKGNFIDVDQIFRAIRDLIKNDDRKYISYHYGIIIQDPLPTPIGAHYVCDDEQLENAKEVLECLDYRYGIMSDSNDYDGVFIPKLIDVDGFIDKDITPCTARGIMDYLSRYVDLYGKNVLIINRSYLVGLPLYEKLVKKDASVTMVHSKSKPEFVESCIKSADVIISAVGKRFIGTTDDYIYKMDKSIFEDKIIVDVGIHVDENNKLHGDIEPDLCNNQTPVPGGCGLLTRLAMVKNLVYNTPIYQIY